jgi:drug/metabolite transporter (DMT)-like permease
MSITAAYLSIIVIWSTTPLAIKWSGDGPGFLFGVTSRMLIGLLICLVILAFMRVRLQWHRQAVHTYLAASLGIFGSMLLVYWGAQYITSGTVSVLFGLTPLLTSVFAAVLLKENSLDVSKIIGIFIALCGLLVVFYSDIASSEYAVDGIIAVLAATTLHSISTVLIKKIDCRLPGIVINTGTLLVSSLLFMLVWLFSDNTLPEVIPLKSGSSILYLGVFGNVIGFTLFFFALKNMDASKIGLIPLITPVIALIIGHAFNAEEVGWTLINGAVLILLGLVAHNWSSFVGNR